MNRILQNLGICLRAKALIIGEDFVLEATKKQQVYLIFLASDASENTKKRIKDKAKTYEVSVDDTFTSDELSRAIGKSNRKVIGVINKDFIKLLKK